MGLLIGEDDVQIPALFALMNERFAPPGKKTYPSKKPPTAQLADGITEMAELQRRFNIFRAGEDAPTFRECAALLNLGGPLPWSLRQKWYKYLDWLHDHCGSEVSGLSGGERINAELEKNLAAESPVPVFFMPYDSKLDQYGGKDWVLVKEKKRGEHPLFYIEEKYIVIELPMYPG